MNSLINIPHVNKQKVFDYLSTFLIRQGGEFESNQQFSPKHERVGKNGSTSKLYLGIGHLIMLLTVTRTNVIWHPVQLISVLIPNTLGNLS